MSATVARPSRPVKNETQNHEDAQLDVQSPPQLLQQSRGKPLTGTSGAYRFASTPRGFALVIGNSQCRTGGHIENEWPRCLRDAVVIKDALRQLGFKVVVEFNVDKRKLLELLNAAKQSASGLDACAFAWCGPGVGPTSSSSDLPSLCMRTADGGDVSLGTICKSMQPEPGVPMCFFMHLFEVRGKVASEGPATKKAALGLPILDRDAMYAWCVASGGSGTAPTLEGTSAWPHYLSQRMSEGGSQSLTLMEVLSAAEADVRQHPFCAPFSEKAEHASFFTRRLILSAPRRRIAGLPEWLDSLHLGAYADAAVEWSSSVGVATLEEAVEHASEFADALQLRPVERSRFEAAVDEEVRSNLARSVSSSTRNMDEAPSAVLRILSHQLADRPPPSAAALAGVAALTREQRCLIPERGGIELIIASMNRHQGDINVQRSGLEALRTLAQLGSAVQGHLCRAGAVESALRSIENFSSAQIQCDAMRTLTALCHKQEAICTVLVEQKGVQSICRSMSSHLIHQELQERAVSLIQVIGSYPPPASNRDIILNQRGLDHIVGAMHKHPRSALLQAAGCAAISHSVLTETHCLSREESTMALRTAKIASIEAVVAALRGAESASGTTAQQIRLNGLSALHAIACHDGYRDAVFRAGGIPEIVFAMQRHVDDAALQARGCKALRAGTFDHPDALSLACHAGAVAATISMVQKHRGDEKLQRASMSFLGNAARSEVGRSQFDSTALETVCLMLRNPLGNYGSSARMALVCLANFASEPASAQPMLRAGALELVLSAAQAGVLEADVQEAVLRVLLCICHSEQKGVLTCIGSEPPAVTAAVDALQRFPEDAAVWPKALQVLVLLSELSQTAKTCCANKGCLRQVIRRLKATTWAPAIAAEVSALGCRATSVWVSQALSLGAEAHPPMSEMLEVVCEALLTGSGFGNSAESFGSTRDDRLVEPALLALAELCSVSVEARSLLLGTQGEGSGTSFAGPRGGASIALGTLTSSFSPEVVSAALRFLHWLVTADPGRTILVRAGAFGHVVGSLQAYPESVGVATHGGAVIACLVAGDAALEGTEEGMAAILTALRSRSMAARAQRCLCEAAYNLAAQCGPAQHFVSLGGSEVVERIAQNSSQEKTRDAARRLQQRLRSVLTQAQQSQQPAEPSDDVAAQV